MRALLLLFLLIPLPAAAEEENYCNEGTTYEMRECAFKRLTESDKRLKKTMKTKTFEQWVGISQRMCEEAYAQYSKGTIYPQLIMKCSIDLNKNYLQKTKGLN